MDRALLCRVLALVFALAVASAAFASTPASKPKLLGSYGGWKAYSYEENGQPVCYMTLVPRLQGVKKFKRGQAYLTITHRPSESSRDVVSYIAGYNYKTTSDVDADVGSKSFNLFTQKDTAWSRDAATDHALATAIRTNSHIKLTGTPDTKNGGPVADSIDLKGSSDAYRAISKACGYPVDAPAKPKGASKTKHT